MHARPSRYRNEQQRAKLQRLDATLEGLVAMLAQVQSDPTSTFVFQSLVRRIRVSVLARVSLGNSLFAKYADESGEYFSKGIDLSVKGLAHNGVVVEDARSVSTSVEVVYA